MWQLLRLQPRLAGLNFIVIVFVSLFSLAVPVVFKALIDGILPDGNRRTFALGIALVASVALGRYIFGVMQDYIFLFHRQAMERAVLALPLSRRTLKPVPIEGLLSGVRNFYASFQMFWVQFVYYIAYAIVISAVVLIIFMLIEPLYFELSVAFMALHAVTFLVFRKPLARQSASYVDAKGRMMTEAESHLRMIDTIKSLAAERFAIDRMNRRVDAVADAYARKELVTLLQQIAQNFLVNVYFISLLTAAILLSMSRPMSLGSATLCMLLAGFLFEPIYRFNNVMRSFFEARAFTSWIQAPETEAAPPTRPAAPAECLRLLDVRATWMSQSLDAVNFECRRGVINLVRGPSGSGKTILLDCIAGHEPLLEGQILLDGRPLAQSDVHYCEQEAAIFEGSVEANIEFFHQHADARRTQELLAELGLAHIASARHKSEDLVGLSGGERLRIAIARGLLVDSPVLLLDEPTAALDAETERRVLDRLVQEARRRIVVVVSHASAVDGFDAQALDLGCRR